MAGNLNQLLAFVLEGYLSNKQLEFGGNSFASEFRASAKAIVGEILGRDDLLIEASVGQGNWAQVPWICIFNPEITTSAQEGVYIGYLFASDMSGVYLFQGQGVTAVRAEFGKDCRQELQRRAGLIQSRIREYKELFSSNRPILSGTTQVARDYEFGTAYSRYYARAKLPSNETLQEDLTHMLRLYDLLVARGGVDNFESISNLGPDEATKGLNFEETRRYIRHSRIERNTKAAKEAKRLSKPICAACGFDFKAVYGVLGEGYIEAHHKIPLHTLPLGHRVQMDPIKDFDLLCSNCHRMIHRSPSALSVEELRTIIRRENG